MSSVVVEEQDVEVVESSDDECSSSLGSSVKSVMLETVLSNPSTSEKSSSIPPSISDFTFFSPSSIQVTALIKSERRFPPPLQEPVDPSELGSILLRRFLASGSIFLSLSMASCALFLSGVSINFEKIGMSVTEISFCKELTLEVASGSSVFRVIGNGTVEDVVTILVMVVLGSVITVLEVTGTTVFPAEEEGILLLEGFG